MDRLTRSEYAEVIQAATRLYPPHLARMAECDFLTGNDPLFVGLHTFEDASYGRSYRDTAHCVYEFHQEHLPRSRRRVTIVFPTVPEVAAVVHEMAHALDARLGFEMPSAPTSWYAETNRFESFAEAVTAWLVPGYSDKRDPALEKKLVSA